MTNTQIYTEDYKTFLQAAKYSFAFCRIKNNTMVGY